MPEVIIGIDAEWQTGSEGNSVLSYQWCGIDGDRCWSGIQYPDLSKPEKQKRLKLAHWVSNALQDEYKGKGALGHFHRNGIKVSSKAGSVGNKIRGIF